MFHQLVEPVSGSLALSFLVAAIPIEFLDTLPAEQIARILAALRPIEALADELRAALRPEA